MMPDYVGLSCNDSILWELYSLGFICTSAEVKHRLQVGVRQQHSVAQTKLHLSYWVNLTLMFWFKHRHPRRCFVFHQSCMSTLLFTVTFLPWTCCNTTDTDSQSFAYCKMSCSRRLVWTYDSFLCIKQLRLHDVPYTYKALRCWGLLSYPFLRCYMYWWAPWWSCWQVRLIFLLFVDATVKPELRVAQNLDSLCKDYSLIIPN